LSTFEVISIANTIIFGFFCSHLISFFPKSLIVRSFENGEASNFFSFGIGYTLVRMQLIQLVHFVYHCDYHHIITIIKYHREIFNQGFFVHMKEELAEVTQYYSQIKFRKINHEKIVSIF